MKNRLLYKTLLSFFVVFNLHSHANASAGNYNSNASNVVASNIAIASPAKELNGRDLFYKNFPNGIPAEWLTLSSSKHTMGNDGTGVNITDAPVMNETASEI